MKRIIVVALVALASTAAIAGKVAKGPGNPPVPPVPVATETAPRVLQVGPSRAYRRIADAAKAALDGDTVEIDAGEYIGDVAVWVQRRVKVRGVGGRPVLFAAGASAEAKAIWVVRTDDMLVENIEFRDAKVFDRNGAGIRHERGRLVVRNCAFRKNEMGLLTSNDGSAELVIENSEFEQNGDGHTHNLYAGSIARLSVKGSWFHRGMVGHLIKSRARENHIEYNRLTDEFDGNASYELEFPNGGLAFVIGNLIQQSNATENPIVVAYGREGYKNPVNELYLSHNTIMNDRTDGGVFVHVEPGAAVATLANNIFVGPGTMRLAAAKVTRDDVSLTGWSDFVLAPRLDLRLRASSPLVGRAAVAPTIRGVSLRPVAEYVHPVGTKALLPNAQLSPGALQSLGQ
jgi:hypothetical protein